MKGIIRWVVLSVLLAGCAKEIHTPFKGDPGASPLRAETTCCKPDATGKYPLDSFTVEEKGSKGSHFFALGGGCIARPIADVWKVARGQEAWHWSRTEISKFEQLKSEAVSFLFSQSYEAGGAPFTQSWTIEYYHSLAKGTLAAPESVLIRYKKVDGTGFIPFWEGTVELTSIGKDLTRFVMRDEIEAAQTELDDSIGSVRDTLTKLRKLKP